MDPRDSLRAAATRGGFLSQLRLQHHKLDQTTVLSPCPCGSNTSSPPQFERRANLQANGRPLPLVASSRRQKQTALVFWLGMLPCGHLHVRSPPQHYPQCPILRLEQI